MLQDIYSLAIEELQSVVGSGTNRGNKTTPQERAFACRAVENPRLHALMPIAKRFFCTLPHPGFLPFL